MKRWMRDSLTGIATVAILGIAAGYLIKESREYKRLVGTSELVSVTAGYCNYYDLLETLAKEEAKFPTNRLYEDSAPIRQFFEDNLGFEFGLVSNPLKFRDYDGDGTVTFRGVRYGEDLNRIRKLNERAGGCSTLAHRIHFEGRAFNSKYKRGEEISPGIYDLEEIGGEGVEK